MDETILLDPRRKKLRVRPLKAYRHFRNLIADKEDTEQVFHIIQSLNGKSLLRDLKRFMNSSEGKKRFDQHRYLPPLLDDHKALAKFPKNTVGAAYLEFMQREGLSAAGLVAEYDGFQNNAERYDDVVEWYVNRKRDTHDLFHILTGYGRDALGEACVLAFSYGQNGGPGIAFISFMAGREIKKNAPRGAPVMRAINQGRRTGKAAISITQQDIIELLAEPLEEARTRLGITAPESYHAVHAMLKEADQDPMQVLA